MVTIKRSIFDIIKPGNHWASVAHGMSGFFVVDMWLNNENDTPFPEPYDTPSPMRHRTYDEAKVEALEWAAANNLPFIK